MKLTNVYNKWLYTPDPEGLTNYDVICAFVFNTIAWAIVFTFVRWLA